MKINETLASLSVSVSIFVLTIAHKHFNNFQSEFYQIAKKIELICVKVFQ